MRQIQKGKEPSLLTKERAEKKAYADMSAACKNAIRSGLVAEQRGLCCYCLDRIKPVRKSMKVEHYQCQDDNPKLDMIYSNMLGACRGNDKKGVSPDEHHCDTKKANLVLCRNPSTAGYDIAGTLRYGGDGKISSTDAQLDDDINDVLNLNLSILKNRRKRVLDAFVGTFPTKGIVPKATVERHLRKFNGEKGDGLLPPFSGVVVYWLQKRLKRYKS